MQESIASRSLVISPRKILRLCFTLLCLLTLAGLIASWLNTLAVEHVLISEARESFVRLFRVDGEANIPAWYSSSLLLLCALVLAVIGKIKLQGHDGYTLHWVLLGIGFVYLSIDEAAVLHEMLNKPVEVFISPAGLLRFAWVIPAAIGVTLAAFLYTRFLFDLPPATRRRFVVAGLLFVGGCVGWIVLVRGVLTDTVRKAVCIGWLKWLKSAWKCWVPLYFCMHC